MSLLADVGLTARIKAALIADERIGARDINVDTSDGVVTLLGRVPEEQLREVADQIALCHGARQVIDYLGIEDRTREPVRVRIPADFPRVLTAKGVAPPARPSLNESVAAAMAADPRVNENLVILRVENGIVFLTGRQETVDASVAASEVAAQVPGVVQVHNDLEVMPSV
jgi:osmotically-inducible protein OsmY